MRKKFFLIALVGLLMTIPSFAQLSVWSGSNSPYTQGSGTSADPYVIETADQLAYLAQLGATNQYFVLNTDIDINGLKWSSIRSFTNSSFDGNHHTIYGLTAPLFGNITSGDIKNFIISTNIKDTIHGSEESSNIYYGVLARHGGTATFDNCFVNGNCQLYVIGAGGTSSRTVYAGGICGGSYGIIKNCINTATIALELKDGTINNHYISGHAAGICGGASEGYIKACVNKGTITTDWHTYDSKYNLSTKRLKSCAIAYRSYSESPQHTSVSYCYNVATTMSEFTGGLPHVYNCYTTASSPYSGDFGMEECSNCWYLSSASGTYTKTDAEMKGAAFPTTLNNDGGQFFICDVTPNVNNGYPILSFQIFEEVTNDTITRGESIIWGDSIYTESGEYYYYTANDWGATKNTLKLVVEEIPVSLTLSVNNAVMGTVSGGGTYLSNDTVSISANANYGYHFVDWSDGNATNPRQIILGATDSSLVANFAINQYAASLATNDPTLGSVTGSGTYAYLSMITATANPQSHCHFVKWSDEVTSNPRYIELTQDTSLTAIFAKDQHVLTVLSNNETAGSVAGGGTFDYYSIVNISATANVGYKFVQWSDGVTTNPRQILVESDLTLTAQFEQCKYQLILQTSDVNAGNVYGGGEFTYGVSTNIAAVANEGYILVDWSDGDTNASRTIIMTDNLTLTANFSAIKYTITAEPNDPSMGMVIGAGEYGYKANVQLMAVANAGYEFVQWSNGETNNPYSFVANADLSIVAEFQETPSALEDVTVGNNATKVVIDGHIYIIRGNSIYNLAGSKVR